MKHIAVTLVRTVGAEELEGIRKGRFLPFVSRNQEILGLIGMVAGWGSEA